MCNSKSNLNPIQKLDYIMSNNPTSLVLKRTNTNEIRIFDDRGYDFLYLGSLVAKREGINFVNPNEAELFRKYNALGSLAELIDCEMFQFERMIFKYLGNMYVTTRSNFLSYGIREQFHFGKKIFLPLKYFIVHNLQTPTFDF